MQHMHILSLRAFPKSEMEGVHGFGELQFGCIQAKQQEGVSHTVALPFTIKSILMKKEELWKLKLKYFANQRCNSQKIL
jgi:hypothetical protein